MQSNALNNTGMFAEKDWLALPPKQSTCCHCRGPSLSVRLPPSKLAAAGNSQEMVWMWFLLFIYKSGYSYYVANGYTYRAANPRLIDQRDGLVTYTMDHWVLAISSWLKKSWIIHLELSEESAALTSLYIAENKTFFEASLIETSAFEAKWSEHLNSHLTELCSSWNQITGSVQSTIRQPTHHSAISCFCPVVRKGRRPLWTTTHPRLPQGLFNICIPPSADPVTPAWAGCR